MKKLIFSISILLLCGMGWGITYTSTQTGNWSDAATWGGSGYPVDGDIAIIRLAHIVTVTENATVGTNGGAGVVAISDTGTLIVNDGIVLTCKGDIILRGGNITLSAGSILQFDGGNYRFYYSTNSSVIVNGSASNRSSITTTSTNRWWLAQALGGAKLTIRAVYCDFYKMGSASNKSMETSNGVYMLSNCKIDDAYEWRISLNSTTDTVVFKKCDFRNMNYTYCLIIGTGSNALLNYGVFDSCTFTSISGAVNMFRHNNSLTRVLINNCVSYNINWQINGNTTVNKLSALNRAGSQGGINIAGTLDSIIYIKNCSMFGTVSNYHAVQVGGGAVNRVYCDSNYSSSSLQYANHYVPMDGGSVDIRIRNCIGRGGNFVISRYANPTARMFVSNCTHWCGDNSNSDYFYIVENVEYTGMDSIVNNLHYSLNTHSRGLIDPASVPATDISYSDHNALYNKTFAERYAEYTTCGIKSVGDAGFGGSDLSADPQFKHDGADFDTWDSVITDGSSKSITSAFKNMLKINGFDSSGNVVTYDNRYNINNFLSYVRDAYTPTNTALKGVGFGGVDIGAMDVYVAPVLGPPEITSISPASGRANSAFSINGSFPTVDSVKINSLKCIIDGATSSKLDVKSPLGSPRGYYTVWVFTPYGFVSETHGYRVKAPSIVVGEVQ